MKKGDCLLDRYLMAAQVLKNDATCDLLIPVHLSIVHNLSASSCGHLFAGFMCANEVTIDRQSR